MKAAQAMRRAALLGLALFALVLAGRGQEPAANRFFATVGPDGVQRVEIVGGAYFFAPNDIVVKANIPVELIVKKVGGKPHKIRMRSPQAGMKFSVCLRKKPKTIRFTPTKTGVYPFWCPMHFPFTKSHRAHGMKGQIEVVG